MSQNRHDADQRLAGDVELDLGPVRVLGILEVPPSPQGLVIFAHGSGSSRLSPRNLTVARHLQDHGQATLLFDLLTDREEGDRRNVFDIGLLATRLLAATDWVRQRPELGGLPLGYFGASTGAAAALSAAAELGEAVAAVVSRGGRPDLATGLAEVTAATLLIVGGRDETVIDLNHRAQQQLSCPNEVEIVAGATHLFEEPGALDTVADLARAWFARYFVAGRR